MLSFFQALLYFAQARDALVDEPMGVSDCALYLFCKCWSNLRRLFTDYPREEHANNKKAYPCSICALFGESISRGVRGLGRSTILRQKVGVSALLEWGGVSYRHSTMLQLQLRFFSAYRQLEGAREGRVFCCEITFNSGRRTRTPIV
jgi:hypothetical protein